MGKLEEIYSQWENNPAFREALKKNPRETLAALGFSLNNSDFEKILHWEKENKPLSKRVNK